MHMQQPVEHLVERLFGGLADPEGMQDIPEAPAPGLGTASRTRRTATLPAKASCVSSATATPSSWPRSASGARHSAAAAHGIRFAGAFGWAAEDANHGCIPTGGDFQHCQTIAYLLVAQGRDRAALSAPMYPGRRSAALSRHKPGALAHALPDRGPGQSDCRRAA